MCDLSPEGDVGVVANVVRLILNDESRSKFDEWRYTDDDIIRLALLIDVGVVKFDDSEDAKHVCSAGELMK
jgi:hypothetical protein